MSNIESILHGGRNSPVSFGLSPPHDGSELEFTELTNLDLFPALQTMNSEDKSKETNIPIIPKDLDISNEEDISDCGSSDSPESNVVGDNGEFLGATSPDNNKIKKISVTVSEEEQLLNYLTNYNTSSSDKKITLKTPCLKIVRLPKDVTGLSDGSSGIRVVKTIAPKRSLESYDDEYIPSSKSSKCMTKNAILAREARRKKKEQLVDLENANKKLLEENQCLKESMSKMEEKTKSLNDEIGYLRSVIANQSTLSSLLKNINTPDIRLTSSECLTDINSNISTKPCQATTKKTKRRETKSHLFCTDNLVTTSKKVFHSSEVAKTDHAYQKPGPSNPSPPRKTTGSLSFSDPAKTASQAAGVCLHVSKGAVSLEFCNHCCNKAGKAFEKLDSHKKD